jgi:hypothetical protein
MDWKSIILHYLFVAKENIAILFGIIFAFLAPISGMLMTVGFFILADTIYKIRSVVKKEGWNGYRSTHLFNIVPKTFFYLGGVILGYLVDFFIVAVPIWGIPLLITKIVCVFWIYIEVKSIDETSVDNGNKSMWTILKELINKGKDLKKDLKNE